MTDQYKTSRLTTALFVIYLIALFWIIVLKFNLPLSYVVEERSVNMVPYSQSQILNGQVDHGEIILNVLIFIPLGIYAGTLFRRWNFGKKLGLAFLISFSCEILQFVFGVGSADITDIINNTLGGLIGLLLYIGIEKAFSNYDKTVKFINIVATIGTVFILSFLILVKMKHLWLFRM